MRVKKKTKKKYLDGKMILVTGGTGSFGKKFVKTVLDNYDVKRMVIYSRDELKQEEMRTVHGFTDSRIRYFIGDVRDKLRLARAMINIDVVVHAAALKQVPAAEYNPMEAIKTNVLGASNIIDVAIDSNVKKVVALSTDKAVNPINLYGATKLLSDKLFIQGNNYSSVDGVKFSCVRYGNVVGSRGSVVPLFLHQKENGKMLTLTDERMTRFWITLDDGVRLVLNAIEHMNGGEIFVPKIPSMKIIDLAKTIAPEAQIKVMGIRPGEKLHETLISQEESTHTYEYKDMYVVRPLSLFNEPNNPIWKKGKLMNPPRDYSSDSNDMWLDEKGMLELIKR